MRQPRYERWQFLVLEGVWAVVLISATTVAVLVGGSRRRGFVMLAVIALASLVVVEVQRRIAAMRGRPDQTARDEAALAAREHQWRRAALGVVFAIMALAFVFVDGGRGWRLRRSPGLRSTRRSAWSVSDETHRGRLTFHGLPRSTHPVPAFNALADAMRDSRWRGDVRERRARVAGRGDSIARVPRVKSRMGRLYVDPQGVPQRFVARRS
jgi:hypothetical protein